MKKYLKYDDNTLLNFDENELTARKVDVSGLQVNIDSVKLQIAELKLIKQTDAKLLRWAKDNFDSVSGLGQLQNQLDELQSLKAIKDGLG